MKRLAGLVSTAIFLVLQAVCLAPPANAATHQVMMQGYAYSPAALTVRAGDTVTWMQHDQAPHDVVTTSAPAAFRSPQLSAGQSWSHTFTKPGTYSYYCSVHPDMRATVTVLAAETPTKQPSAAPSKQTTARPATSSAPSSSPPPTSSEAPAPVVPESSAPAPPVTQEAAATGPSLDPMLLVAGVVTAVAVLCLLLVGSRPAG
ncbi:cupredoxin family copper-binding protein [Amycolatopsis sp. EV170708-02-1]|uniref:cupredoxin domain-containing protein n=1 Tax=Amycolatopsis sp. EV170708-02-1 TaxID=2919322 RepID=UPI001F0B90E9|nr:cupredoxin family copper-binding protein [Amycolatopsis sp. EV170708-02-1]UMP05895.1 cupredoxin family copper-binding protein [Amycolatopsis sp. EV170708-02-1]